MDKIVEQVLEELRKMEMKSRGSLEDIYPLEYDAENVIKAIELAVQKAKNPFTPEELELLKDLVKNSVGYDLDRQDFKVLLKKLEGLK